MERKHQLIEKLVESMVPKDMAYLSREMREEAIGDIRFKISDRLGYYPPLRSLSRLSNSDILHILDALKEKKG